MKLNVKVSEDVKQRHRLLSDCSSAYLEFVERTPAALKHGNYSQLKWADEKVRLQPWPTFINKNMKRRLHHAGKDVFELLKQIPKRLFANDPVKLSRYLELPLRSIQFFLNGFKPQHLDYLLARGDFILSEDEELKCIEFNIASNLGGWELPIWEKMHMQHPITSTFIKQYNVKVVNENLMEVLFEHIIDSTLSNPGTTPGNSGTLNLGLALEAYDPHGPKGEDPLGLTPIYRKVLHRKAPHLQGRVIAFGFPLLRERNGEAYIQNERIPATLIYALSPIPMQALNVFYNGKLLLFNSTITGLLANKLIFALLSQQEDSQLFTPEEREVIKKYVPWTRKTESGENTYQGDKIQLEDFVRQNRRKLILKPSKGSGAKGMCNGTMCSEEQWAENVSKAFSERNWVVQEYIPSASFIYQIGEEGLEPYYPIWGPFIFGKKYGGTWVRILPVSQYKGAISSSYFGAQESVILEVDE